jgi:sugar O-acyltransferase (sialic acid O-acetyltransferase NeuD family)
MKDIAIYGAGGFGKEIACLINVINKKEPKWNLIGFFDDDPSKKGQMISHFGNCLGGFEVLNAYPKELAVVFAMGHCKKALKCLSKISNSNIYFPNIIHPNIVLNDPDSFKIGKGNVIQANCTMSCDVSIGDFNVLNGSVVLGHDVKIGSHNTIMPGVRISGGVSIGDNNTFGISSVVLQRIGIGSNVTLGAGGILMTKPKDGCLYMGNPAKKTDF